MKVEDYSMYFRINDVEKATDLVLSEVDRQETLWGVQTHDWATWMVILGEEFGETCKEAYEISHNTESKEDWLRRLNLLRNEAIQTAAVAVSLVADINRIIRSEFDDAT